MVEATFLLLREMKSFSGVICAKNPDCNFAGNKIASEAIDLLELCIGFFEHAKLE